MVNKSFDMIYCAAIGDSAAIRCIVDLGIADEETMRFSLLQCGIDGNTQKHSTIVRILTRAGVDPNTRGSYGWTPLHWAARHGHTRTAKALLEAGADPFIADEHGTRPIDFAQSGAEFGFGKPRKNFQKIVDMMIDSQNK
jgi:ankyrin repeat protein